MALAPGQKSLVGMFSQQTVKPSSSISKESIEAPEVVHVGEEKFASTSKEKNEQNDKQNEIKQPESKEGEANSMWYKGKKLDSSWLILSGCCLKILTEMKNKKRRQVMTCELCKKYEVQVAKFSVNRRLLMASEVRIDGKEKLKWVIDHLESPSHNESKRLKEHEDTWRSISTDHPWARMIEKHKKETGADLGCRNCLAQGSQLPLTKTETFKFRQTHSSVSVSFFSNSTSYIL